MSLNWTERKPAGDLDRNWASARLSSNGAFIIACDYGRRVWISSNSGLNWAETRPAGDLEVTWYDVACDSDGSFLMAGAWGGGGEPDDLYATPDSGANWTLQNLNGANDILDIASDDDGSNLICSTYGGGYGTYYFMILLSIDSGAIWNEIQPQGSRGLAICVASDDDGSALLVGYQNNRLWHSTNSGLGWTERRPDGNVNRDWTGADLSSDGSVAIVCCKNSSGINGGIYISTNSCIGWTEVYPTGIVEDKEWQSVACSGDGSVMVAVVGGGRAFVTFDTGLTWEETQPAGNQDQNWDALDVSADGKFFIIGGSIGRLYTSPVPIIYDEAGKEQVIKVIQVETDNQDSSETGKEQVIKVVQSETDNQSNNETSKLQVIKVVISGNDTLIERIGSINPLQIALLQGRI